MNTLKRLINKKLPLLASTRPDQKEVHCHDLEKLLENENETVAIEFDLRRVKQIERNLKIQKLDCYPLFWSYLEKKSQIWELKFR